MSTHSQVPSRSTDANSGDIGMEARVSFPPATPFRKYARGNHQFFQQTADCGSCRGSCTSWADGPKSDCSLGPFFAFQDGDPTRFLTRASHASSTPPIVMPLGSQGSLFLEDNDVWFLHVHCSVSLYSSRPKVSLAFHPAILGPLSIFCCRLMQSVSQWRCPAASQRHWPIKRAQLSCHRSPTVEGYGVQVG